jgi:DNA segregation ATPase FtsK/SpoIIIE-like protein
VSDDDILASQIKKARAALKEKAKGPANKMTGCTSYIQRSLQCGYNRAALIIDYLVSDKFISEPDDTGARHLI